VKRRRARRATARLRAQLAGLPPIVWVLVASFTLAGANWLYQAARKPTELLGLIVPSAPKVPAATWAAYGPLFRAHATDVMRPELLAALVQVESAGDPLARTYWRWGWSLDPREIYRPASSAVGLLQITDGTFEEARRYCIHDHGVAEAGSWSDPRACWFNGLYLRTLPGDAIEMTSARLDRVVAETLAERRISLATLDQRQQLAAVVHLCGRQRGAAFAGRGFRTLPGERCGDHHLAGYLARVQELEIVFARLAAGEDVRG
jgi:hypothetical protein